MSRVLQIIENGLPQEPGATNAAGGGALVPFAALLEAYPGPAILFDGGARVVAANPAADALKDVAEAEEAEALRLVIATCSGSGEAVQDRLSVEDGDKHTVFDVSLLPLRDAEQRPWVLLMARDVTLENNLTKALTSSRTLFRDLVMCSSDFAWETDERGCFNFVSPRGALGYEAIELSGSVAREFLAVEGDMAIFECRQPLDDVEVRARRKDGTIAVLEVSALPFEDEGRYAGSRGVCRDVSEAREREAALALAHEKLRHLSRTDELTGLINRRAFCDTVTRRMLHDKRHDRVCSLLYLDLDGFKPVNDRYGHGKGDEILRLFADRMRGRSRVGDLVARLGGDEFAVWLQDTDLEGAVSKAEALIASCRLIASEVGIADCPISTSVGIAATDPGSGESFDDILGRADAAMYVAKRRGKSRVSLADPPEGGNTA